MPQAESIDGANVLKLPDVSGSPDISANRLAEVVVLTRLGGAAAMEAAPIQTAEEELAAMHKAVAEQTPTTGVFYDQFGNAIPSDKIEGHQSYIAHYNSYIAELCNKPDIRALL